MTMLLVYSFIGLVAMFILIAPMFIAEYGLAPQTHFKYADIKPVNDMRRLELNATLLVFDKMSKEEIQAVLNEYKDIITDEDIAIMREKVGKKQ